MSGLVARDQTTKAPPGFFFFFFAFCSTVQSQTHGWRPGHQALTGRHLFHAWLQGGAPVTLAAWYSCPHSLAFSYLTLHLRPLCHGRPYWGQTVSDDAAPRITRVSPYTTLTWQLNDKNIQFVSYDTTIHSPLLPPCRTPIQCPREFFSLVS